MAYVSGWHDKALAVGLFAQPRRLVKRCVVAQRGVANARQLVRQRAGGLVVTASPLHIQRPAAHALYLLARPLRHLGRSQHTARAMREQHAQVAVALLGDAPQVAAAARAVLAWRQAKPTGEVACVLEVCHVARGGCHQGCGGEQSNAGYRQQQRAGRALPGSQAQLSLHLGDARFQQTSGGVHPISQADLPTAGRVSQTSSLKSGANIGSAP